MLTALPFTEGDIYVYVGLGFDLGSDWTLGGTLGYYEFAEDGERPSTESPEAVLSYGHAQIDLGKSTDMGDFTFSLSYVEEDEAYDDDIKAVVSWGTSF